MMNSYECKECNVLFINLNSFKTHLRRKHGITYSIWLSECDESIELIECKICGIKLSNIGSHLKHTHDMNGDEYKKKFNVDRISIQRKSTIEKMKKTKGLRDTKNKRRLQRQKDTELEERKIGYEPLTCKICGYESMTSLISHITRKHKVKMSDYREKYPNELVQRASQAHKKKNSDTMKKRLEDPVAYQKFMEWRCYPSEVKFWERKGFSHDDAVKKASEFQSESGLKQNNYPEMLKEKGKRQSGNRNPMSLESIAKREGVSIEEASKLTPAYGRVGELHPMWGKKHTDEALRKIGEAINHSGRSKVEHELTDKLVDLYGGKKNYGLIGWSCDYVDFERKIVVEMFGDFWHHNPQKFKKEYVNPITKAKSFEVWNHDIRKLSELSKAGYKVIVIWESEWKYRKEECLQRIKDAYNRA